MLLNFCALNVVMPLKYIYRNVSDKAERIFCFAQEPSEIGLGDKFHEILGDIFGDML